MNSFKQFYSLILLTSLLHKTSHLQFTFSVRPKQALDLLRDDMPNKSIRVLDNDDFLAEPPVTSFISKCLGLNKQHI